MSTINNLFIHFKLQKATHDTLEVVLCSKALSNKQPQEVEIQTKHTEDYKIPQQKPNKVSNRDHSIDSFKRDQIIFHKYRGNGGKNSLPHDQAAELFGFRCLSSLQNC